MQYSIISLSTIIMVTFNLFPKCLVFHSHSIRIQEFAYCGNSPDNRLGDILDSGKVKKASNSILLNTLIHVVDGPRLLVGRGPGYEARLMDAWS